MPSFKLPRGERSGLIPALFAIAIAFQVTIGAGDGLISTAQAVPPPVHGDVAFPADRGMVVWSEVKMDWVDPVDFWLTYADERGGLTWGRGTDYPPYGEVSEFDTFLAETAEGPCLMEFYHRRWRRANDVRRWNDAFNDYGGCPTVFD